MSAKSTKHSYSLNVNEYIPCPSVFPSAGGTHNLCLVIFLSIPIQTLQFLCIFFAIIYLLREKKKTSNVIKILLSQNLFKNPGIRVNKMKLYQLQKSTVQLPTPTEEAYRHSYFFCFCFSVFMIDIT